MGTSLTVTQEELLSLAPDLRNRVRETVSNRRAPAEPPKDTLTQETYDATANIVEVFMTSTAIADARTTTTVEEDPLPFSDAPEQYESQYPDEWFDKSTPVMRAPNNCEHCASDHAATTCISVEEAQRRARDRPSNVLDTFTLGVAGVNSNPPAGAIVVPDVYDQYLRDNPDNYDEDRLVVAMDSSAIRSIVPLYNHDLSIESILDPGSQIISMSEAVCHELSLIYDPEVILTMQSANGTLDKSLGLARNVPVSIGDITLYLQIHVLRGPAYDILLGRPFDILTRSIVRNFANENQTITIHDPNSYRTATVPTVPRGPPRFCVHGHRHKPPSTQGSGHRASRN